MLIDIDVCRVDNFSHMGGLIAGILLSVFLLPPIALSPDASSRIKRASVYMLRMTGLLLYVALLGLLIHHFATGDIDQVSLSAYNAKCI
jgi:hypothetical protein